MTIEKDLQNQEAMDEKHAAATLITEEQNLSVPNLKLGESAELSPVLDPREERRLLSKLDRLILPLTALLYLSAYLDRGNLGNAKLQGLYAHILDSNSTRFSVVLCAFYITYILLSIPGTLLSRAILPSTCIAIGAIIWSISASSMAGATNYASVIVCRLFIGVGEALFGQSVTLYYSIWYKKNEVSQRLAIFIGAGALAGAFGGLIAYGVAHVKGSLATWRILFLIEGLPSVVLAVVIFFALPSRPETSRYLNDRERAVLAARLKMDGLLETHSSIDWEGVRRALTDWKTYVVALLYSSMNLTLASVSGFLPSIISSMGYSNASAQLHTVPPYAVAFVFMISMAKISDKLGSRGLPVASVFTISSIGWIILLNVESNHVVRYFSTFCVVIGGYCSIPLIMGWVSNNTATQSQRAVSLGMLNTVGQCLSIVAAFIFPDSERPRWKKGFATNLAFNLLGITIALSMSVYFRYENRRRDRVEGRFKGDKRVSLDEVELTHLCDLTPGFRYVP